MNDTQVSLTAQLTAFARAYHATHDDPKIFDDFLAKDILTAQEQAFFGQNLAKALAFFEPESVAAYPDEASALARVMQIQSTPVTISRSRYTEDALEAAAQQGVRQYVILGAGLDTFAFRRPDLMERLDVFEIDHPATQAFKRQRIGELGWECPAKLHFVPVDFSKEDLVTALEQSSYDPKAPSFFSWLGVTYYLTPEAVFTTLRAIASLAATGSTLVFDYMDTDAFDPECASTQSRRVREITRNAGEPLQTGFDPATLGAELAGVGLRLEENLSPEDIEARFFHGRGTRYHALEHTHFARATVE